MPNLLAQETSPYLLEHAENPVDWYPWGEEALDAARERDLPIFLSIGYSACHWCHVMAHESFENAELARQLNENFVPIKVDREERPDLDQVYMSAVQIMTGRGGWPMSVFLTPDLKPFYGGTYWPPSARMGMPGFDQVLAAVSDAWKNRREQALEQAGALSERIREVGTLAGAADAGLEFSPRHLETAAAQLERVFDHTHGGFGGAPKFPHPMDLRVLLRHWARSQKADVLDMVTLTLDKMAAGGIYDHLGGGFHRYSVDERWLVPHFEKMLYDNALLAGCYVEAFQATSRHDYATVIRETLDYVLREMTDTLGGFYSTQDADTEGVEGKFYVWTPAEVEKVLGDEEAHIFCYVYDVSDAGNFEHANVLNRPKTLEQASQILGKDRDTLKTVLADARAKLFAARSHRVPPHRDDKLLVSWNGLMIDAFARAAGALGEPKYLEAATRAAGFILGHMRREDGRLLHSWRGGRARFDAYLDDYTHLADALVTLYEQGHQERYIDEAMALVETMREHFADPDGGGFYYTADDHEELIARQKDVLDSSVPSGNAMAATVLTRLGKLTSRVDLIEEAQKTVRAFAAIIERSATACGQMLIALDALAGPFYEIAIISAPDDPATRAVLSELNKRFLPNKVLALRTPQPAAEHRTAALDPLFEGKTEVLPSPTVYICENFTCQQPASGKEAALAAIEKLA